jgi:hypothetical protein
MNRRKIRCALPGEIRNRIYQYATGGYAIDVSYRKSFRLVVTPLHGAAPALAYEDQQSYGYLPRGYLPASRIFNLRRLCRQTRAETTHLGPYTDNIFYITGDAYVFKKHFRRLSTQERGAIRTIALGSKFTECTAQLWTDLDRSD